MPKKENWGFWATPACLEERVHLYNPHFYTALAALQARPQPRLSSAVASRL